MTVCADEEDGMQDSKRFMRFGRQPDLQQLQPVDDVRQVHVDSSQPSTPDKRFMRFGREFMRFGRDLRRECNLGDADCK